MPTPEEEQEAIKQQCPFCKIAKGEIPSKEVYTDEKIMSVLDIKPAILGHTVVFPKEHFMMLPQIPFDIFSHMFKKSAKVCGAIKKALISQGTTLFIANGGAAGQQAYHFTLHIMPRDKGDGLNNFNIPKNKLSVEEVQKLQAPLNQHITQRVVQTYQQAGKEPPKVKQAGVSPDQILSFIESNQQVKQMLLQNPEQFKQILPQNPELAKIFSGIDIDKLVEILRQKAK